MGNGKHFSGDELKLTPPVPQFSAQIRKEIGMDRKFAGRPYKLQTKFPFDSI
jgi:hypothetical protein